VFADRSIAVFPVGAVLSGKREGAGRNPKPPDERRDQVFSIKRTLDEKRLLEETNAREWARR
jgi:hypothetical protein